MEEDKKLYEKFLNGDKSSFEKLILKYKNNLIYFISRYVKNMDVAEDVFQEVIVFILEKKDYYNFDYSFKTYIYMIARSKALDHLKREKKTESLEDLKIDFEDNKLLEEIILTKERQDKIQNVMKKMSSEYQLVIYLTQIEGLSYRETALILDKTESKIKALAFNARKKLKKLLIKENVIEVKNHKIIILISMFIFISAVITGATYADEIVEFVKEFFGANASDGVDTAVNHGFVAEGKSKNTTEGITISIESFIMDDYNFGMNFLLTFNDKYDDVNEIAKYDISLEDLRILDENNKIVFSTNYERNLKNDETIEPEYWNGYTMQQKVVSDNQIMIYLSSASEVTVFPKSKKLNISFTRIALKNLPDLSKNIEVYQGDWKFEENVPEEMYNREVVIYKVKSCNDDKTVVENAVLSNTAFKISIPVTTTDKIDYKALYDRENMKSIYSLLALQKEYVETSDGKRFEVSKDGTNGYGGEEEKIIDYHQTFDLTKFDATDELTVHIFTNKGEEIIICFEK